MLHKTRGIVFKTTDYGESSVVVQVFTEKFGLQSYLINGVKKPRARIRQNVLQSLHLLDMVVYNKPFGSIQRVSELRNLPVYQSIPYDIVKSSLAMFLNEVLYKSVRQQTADDVLFEFLFNALEILDSTGQGLANFHLYFLLRLTRYLGFYPEVPAVHIPEYFDLKNGQFSVLHPDHAHILQQPHTGYWADLLKCNFNNLHLLNIPGADRKIMLVKILEYYRLHIEGFGEVKSHHVLEQVLS